MSLLGSTILITSLIIHAIRKRRYKRRYNLPHQTGAINYHRENTHRTNQQNDNVNVSHIEPMTRGAESTPPLKGHQASIVSCQLSYKPQNEYGELTHGLTPLTEIDREDAHQTNPLSFPALRPLLLRTKQALLTDQTSEDAKKTQSQDGTYNITLTEQTAHLFSHQELLKIFPLDSVSLDVQFADEVFSPYLPSSVTSPEEQEKYRVFAKNEFNKDTNTIHIRIDKNLREAGILARVDRDDLCSFLQFIILNELVQATEKMQAPHLSDQDLKQLEFGSQVSSLLILSHTQLIDIEHLISIFQKMIDAGKELVLSEGDFISQEDQNSHKRLVKVFKHIQELTQNQELSPSFLWTNLIETVSSDEIKQDVSDGVDSTFRVLSAA